MDDTAENETILGGQKSRNPERSAFEDKYRVFHMLSEAHSTIADQAAQIARLQPKADAYDVIARMWRDNSNGAGGWAVVDPAWERREMLDRMTREFEAEKAKAYEAREHGDADHYDETRPERPIDRMARGTTAAADLSGVGVLVKSETEPEPGT